MKVDKVFVAFLKKDEEEHLLYKENDNLYYDLINKVYFTNDDIDMRTLIYFRDTIKCLYNYMLKFNIKRKYIKDRKELLDVDTLYIVNLKKVSRFQEKYESHNDMVYQNWVSIFLYKALLKKYIGSYKDLRNGRLYFGRDPYRFENGTIYVDDGINSVVIPLNQYCPFQSNLEKKQVLKLAYKVSMTKE